MITMLVVVNKLLSRILANIMDQLGDLGRHAVEIMDGIGTEIVFTFERHLFAQI